MKWQLLLLSFIITVCWSCHKEYSCEGCIPGTPAPVPPPPPPPPPNTQVAVITSLNCASGSISSKAIEGIPYSGQYTVSYTGGNGGIYKADTITSTGVNGLIAIVSAGMVTNGNGDLAFYISGTPASAGNAIFIISFAGKSCTATLQIDDRTIVLNGLIKTTLASQKGRNLFVTNNAAVKAWGDNLYGELGDGTTTRRNTPVLLNNLSNIAAVATGAFHSLALGYDGKVWTWGWNGHGQLGDGTLIDNHNPKQVAGITGVVSLAAGYDFTLALKNDGTVWAWGDNLWGVLGDGTYISKTHPVQVTNLSGIVAIAAGEAHCLALKNDGTIWSWGWNFNGCLGDGSTVSKRSTPMQIPALTGITMIAANGSVHSMALKNDGTVWVWGDNFHGQLGDGIVVEKLIPEKLVSLTNIISIGTGENHSFAIRNDGTLWSWGWNAVGALGVDFNFVSHQLNPVNVALLPGVKQIMGGSFHTVAQKTDGTVFAMGSNVFGQLGDGTNIIYRYVPMIVPGL